MFLIRQDHRVMVFHMCFFFCVAPLRPCPCFVSQYKLEIRCRSPYKCIQLTSFTSWVNVFSFGSSNYPYLTTWIKTLWNIWMFWQVGNSELTSISWEFFFVRYGHWSRDPLQWATLSDKTLSHKTDEILARWRIFLSDEKFCPTKNFVQKVILKQ